MYRPEDYIVYGTNGVCRITELCKSPFSPDDERLYYVMQPLSDRGNSVIYSPVDNTAVPMRPLMTREEISDLIQRIPTLPLLEIEIEKHRKEVYRQVMSSVDPDRYMRLIKTVYHRRQVSREKRKRLPEMDNEYDMLARKSLYTELSIVLEIPDSEVEAYLTASIEALGA